MSREVPKPALAPFFLLTSRLVLVPTPLAVHIPSYRHLYAGLHASPSFCDMAFGHHFLAAEWSDDETREVIQARDIMRCWARRGMGDFAVGLRSTSDAAAGEPNSRSQPARKLSDGLYLVEASHLESAGLAQGDITWAGYAGVRDATTTSVPSPIDSTSFPPWQEMVEIRYGVAQAYWGQGLAREAAESIMQWAKVERGVRRFIAETEQTNVRSGNILSKMGFTRSGTNYWQEPSELEWERWS